MFKFQNDKNATVRSIAKELKVRPSTVYSTYCNINEYAKLYEEISNKLDNITSIQELLNKLNDKLELNNKNYIGRFKIYSL